MPSPYIRVAIEFKSFKGFSKRISSRNLSSKHHRGEGSSSGRFTSAEDDVIQEGCGLSLGWDF